MAARNAHCSFCGVAFPVDAGWPRDCRNCGNRSYLNPLPVAVALVPVADGLLTIRRAIQPRLGELALPGGFIDLGEDWRNAVARELREETGITIDPGPIHFFEALSSPGGHILLFGLCPALTEPPVLVPNAEVSELVIIPGPIDLAFPLHTEAARRFFAH